VLDLNSNDVKALYRKAMCRKELGMYNEALYDLNIALSIDSSLKEVRTEIVKLKRLIQEHRKTEKSIYGRMFK